jgi:predicted ATP-dependent endonuclease of OLD family
VQKLIQSVFKEGSVRAKKVMPLGTELKFSIPSATDALEAILSLSAVLTSADGSLSIRDEGSGFQSLLALGLLDYAISGKKQRGSNDLLLIEEPEVFLHPQYQRTVAKYVSNLAEKAQVFVTTHSPIIIDSVPISSVARLSRHSGGLKYKWKAHSLSAVESGRLERFCDAKNSELVFADKVVFCEGPTDARVVQALIKQKDTTDQSPMNVSVIDMNGKQSIHHFV